MPIRPLKIGFLSQFSPNDRRDSSGTNYKMAEHLSKIGHLHWIKIRRQPWNRFVELFEKAFNKLSPKKIKLDGTLLWGRFCEKPLDKKELDRYDIIVAFFCSNTLARLNTDTTIIYFTDATFPCMLDYYRQWTNLPLWNRNSGTQVEKAAMDKASAIIVSSDWARNSAVQDLNQDKRKVHVVEFGANIDDSDLCIEIPHTSSGALELLFLGVDWERKGGAIAIDAINHLNNLGIKATLHIAGIKNPPAGIENNPHVNFMGFLNKNIPEHYRRLVDVIGRSTALLLPTKAECAGIAFAEAEAFGLPVFSHDTGGVSNYVHDGCTGRLLPLGSTGADFAEAIADAVRSGAIDRYSDNARALYKERLNWNTWGERVSVIINSIVDK